MTRLVAIHQPNFFPWLGFFDKVARADTFIFMDNVQFQKKGATWTNRVQLLVGGKEAWVTAPIVRGFHGVRTVREMRTDGARHWRPKIVKTIQSSYARAPHFAEVFPLLEELISDPTDRLADYNEAAILRLAEALGLNRPTFVRGSTLAVNGRATELLIKMVGAVGGSAYLSGGGAGGYQDDAAFEAAGLELVEQRFESPPYPQMVEPHVPGLSIVDALMSCGWSGTAEMLGAGPPP